MESFEGIWDFEIEKIDADIMDIKQKARIEKIISEINMYKEDKYKITDIYTNILCDKEIVKVMTKVSQSVNFYNQFPEYFNTNEFGENVINCQQNSKFHKYGVFRHILESIKNVGNNRSIPYSDYEIKILKWTMFLHDIGKPMVKVTSEEGNDSFLGHDDISAEIAKGILDRFQFSQEEKNIIIKLIKYHDKYINQGEITYDNMKFLASELENNKKIFNLLLEVKEADAKAKCEQVYKTFLIVKQKYIEFMNTYFSYDSSSLENGDLISNSIEGNTQNIKETVTSINEITNEEYENVLLDTINRKNINVYYQPMIDVKEKCVAAYEAFSKIYQPQKVLIPDLLNYSKKVAKFDKIQQILMINSISDFEKIESKESKSIFINIDFDSYNRYVNKPRIYDMMTKNKVIIEFKNYASYASTELEMVIKTIRQHGGFVSLDNYGIGSIPLERLEIVKPNFIKFDVEFLNNISVDSEKQRYLMNVINNCSRFDVEIIAVGVEDRNTLITLKNIGIRYVQGYFFGQPDKAIRNMNQDISKLITSINNETTL